MEKQQGHHVMEGPRPHWSLPERPDRSKMVSHVPPFQHSTRHEAEPANQPLKSTSGVINPKPNP